MQSGTVANRMTRGEIVAKVRDLMDEPLGPKRSTELIDAIFALDTLASVRSLRPLLQCRRLCRANPVATLQPAKMHTLDSLNSHTQQERIER